jgi:hypothetical protein
MLSQGDARGPFPDSPVSLATLIDLYLQSCLQVSQGTQAQRDY